MFPLLLTTRSGASCVAGFLPNQRPLLDMQAFLKVNTLHVAPAGGSGLATPVYENISPPRQDQEESALCR